MKNCSKSINKPCWGSSRGVVNNGLQQGVVHLGLIKAAHQENDWLANALNKTLWTSDSGKKVHQPVAWQELTQAHHVQNPLKMFTCTLEMVSRSHIVT